MIKALLLVNWGIGEKIVDALHRDERVEIAAVATQFEKDSKDPWKNAVYFKAKQYNYDIINTTKLKFKNLKNMIAKKEIDLLVVHAYMRILPPEVFSAPPFGSINVHPSLLPKYRGANPSVDVLKNREKQTGVTCHYIDEGKDTGNIISQRIIDVSPLDTRESLIDKMKPEITKLMNEVIYKVMDGDKGTPQSQPMA